MKRLIINADDLGCSLEVNTEIFQLLDNSFVSSATLMMNGPAIESAVKELPHYPNASFGVHLNVTEFPFLTEPFCEGILSHSKESIRKRKLTNKIIEAIYFEWSKQLQLARSFNVPISHIDTHHHIHTHPALFFVLKKIQKQYSIRKVRISRNIYNHNVSLNFQKHFSKSVWNFALKHYLPTVTTDGFTDFKTFYNRLCAGIPWGGTVELMCHPGHISYDDETKLLRSDWKQHFASEAKVINYNGL